MPEPQRVRLLILDDNAVQNMLRRADIVQEFPFLRGFAERVNAAAPKNNGKPCSSCRKKSEQGLGVNDYSTIRQVLDRLTKPQKDRLRLLLNADAIRMYYNNEMGNRVRATIS